MEPASAIVSNAGLPDVIAYVWYQLGYRPQDSLILAGVHGPQFRLGVIARADLPGPHVRRSLLAADVRSLAGSLVSAGADQVMALLCADDVLRPPEPALVRVLTTELPQAGLRVMDVIGLGPASYRSLLCHDRACCPAGGIPLDDVLATRTAATEVLFGRTLGSCEADVIADVIPAGPEAGPGVSLDHGDDPGEGGDRLALWRMWCEAFRSGQELTAGPARTLCRSLDDAGLRDAVLLHALGAPPDQCEALLAGGRISHPMAGLLDALLVQVLEREPGADQVRSAQAVLASAARLAPPGERAPVLAILAALAWFEGNGLRARLLAERALADRPRCPLALLVQDLLFHTVIPPRMRQRRSGSGGEVLTDG